MAGYDFSQVEAVLIEPQLNTLRLFRDMLARMGMTQVQACDKLETASPIIKGSMADLLFIDVPETDSGELALIRGMRQEKMAANPFLTIIATSWYPSQLLMLRVANAGADDFLSKPVSPKQVLERLVSQIEGRRPFVVTSDYIGPDRRRISRPGAQIAPIAVPNTLRAKVSGRFDKTALQQAIDKTSHDVNAQKVIRDAVQIAFLVEFALPGLTAAPPERMALDHVVRIPGVVEDLLQRMPDSPIKDKVLPLCQTLIRAVEAIRQHAETAPPAKGLTMVREQAYGVLQTVQPGRPAEQLSKDVLDAVTAYRTRLAEMTAAKAIQGKPVASTLPLPVTSAGSAGPAGSPGSGGS